MKKKIEDILIKGKKYRDPDYSAKALAENLDMSVFQIARKLKKEFGKSYSDIILPLRIKEAQKHLHDDKKSTYTMEEIGILVGFKNKWSFYQAFNKYAGMTPKEWKNRTKEIE